MLIDEINDYQPDCEEEKKEKENFLLFLKRNPDCLSRACLNGQVSSSAWIVNKTHDRYLMCYHRIYDSWSWIGGHADNESDTLKVAIKESQEETGIKNFKVLDDKIFSLECLCVLGHYKRGQFVSSHLHYNVTYLLEADDLDSLIIKEDENKGLKWFTREEVLTRPSEPWMVEHIYKKMIRKSDLFFEKK